MLCFSIEYGILVFQMNTVDEKASSIFNVIVHNKYKRRWVTYLKQRSHGTTIHQFKPSLDSEGVDFYDTCSLD